MLISKCTEVSLHKQTQMTETYVAAPLVNCSVLCVAKASMLEGQ